MSAHPELEQSVVIGEDTRRATFRRFRLEAGVNQTRIAKAAGIDRATYNRWERGRYFLDDQPLILVAGFLCTCRLSDLDREELIKTLAGKVSGSTVIGLRTSLTDDLFLVRLVEEELSRLTSLSSNS